jgi:Helicase conserved C-terminal domain
MSAATVSLKNVLTQTFSGRLDLENMDANSLKGAARFWLGTTMANKLRKAECCAALGKLLRDRKQVIAGLSKLPDKQRQILAIFALYGGAMSRKLLKAEALARGLVEEKKEQTVIYGRDRREDPVHDLGSKLFLLPRHDSSRNYYYPSYRLEFTDQVLLPGIVGAIEPAAFLLWQPSAPTSAPTATSLRSAAEVAFDLWTVAQGLVQARPWKTNRGGSLAKSVQNKLKKLFSSPDDDPLLPVDPESLYYEILRGLGAVKITEGEGWIDLKAVENHLREPDPVQAWHWVRAWMQSPLWQDGIGVVPDRDSDIEPVRIRPGELLAARELLVWSLCRVAGGTDDWLDLETFLIDLWSATGEDGLSFYWHGYSWNPHFKSSRNKEDIPAGKNRLRAFWLDEEGTWAANALMGTLRYLGLIERGQRKLGGVSGFFRLTGLGKAVFGAPEIRPPQKAHDAKFLTVQPNHEIVVYLDLAEASAVLPLAQMARRVSAAGGLVQTFALTRDGVYQALESGLELEEIQRFLIEHSNTGLPANVAYSIREWGNRRESMVLRTDVSLSMQPDKPPALLPKKSALPRGTGTALDHRHFAHPAWHVEEDGRVIVTKDADSVTLARLTQFADADGVEWRITAGSIRRARDRGIPAEQVLGWLNDHLAHVLPPIVETMIRNWFNPQRIFFGDLLMLQITQPQACAMLLSTPRFQAYFVGHIPPNWFLVQTEKRGEMERVLIELGFAVDGSYRLTALPEGEAVETRPVPHRPRGRPRKRG